jgi:PmbA protein
VSGEFSLGIKGASISGGALGGAVSGMTIAGNLKDILNTIDLIGNDFRFYGSTGACSLVVRDVAAAGS